MFLLDALYLFLVGLAAPWLFWRAARTGRYRRDLGGKLLGRTAFIPDGRPVAWFHGVSVGEIHLLVTLVAKFRERHPGWRVVVSSTTDTGLAEARAKFADVVAWPLDFSWAVAAALDAVRPRLIVLAEAELWPNFLRAAADRGIPVAVVNARMSPRSARRLAVAGAVARRFLYARVAVIAAQAEEYAARFRALGVPAARVRVTGSVKYDGAAGDRDTPKARALRTLLASGGRKPAVDDLILVAGSTHAPEEQLVLAAFASLRPRLPGLRLVLVPRHPDRFAEVARLVESTGFPFVRRSRLTEPTAAAVVLLDTLGELGAAWALADVGYVGGTLDGVRGGQSMIEPAGYGVPTVFGPHVWNFRDAARRLTESGGAIMLGDAGGLTPALADLLADPEKRRRMGAAARALVAAQQGATARTLDVLDELIGPASDVRAAA